MVHDVWLTMFNQYCFSVLTLKLKGGEARLKDGGAPCYHPLGETLLAMFQTKTWFGQSNVGQMFQSQFHSIVCEYRSDKFLCV